MCHINRLVFPGWLLPDRHGIFNWCVTEGCPSNTQLCKGSELRRAGSFVVWQVSIDICDNILTLSAVQVIHVPKEKQPLMIRKSDGGFGYGTTDMATLKQRIHVSITDCSPQLLIA